MNARPIQSWRSFCAAAAIAGVVAAGCQQGDGIPRVAVSGAVRFRRQPVEDGQIRFVPEAGLRAPVTIEPIRAGKYDCTCNGGVPIGRHRVEILAWDPKVPEPTGFGQRPRPQWIPAEYNRQSTLSIAIDGNADRVVKDFDL